MEQPTVARKTKVEILSAASVATLKSDYGTWRDGAGEAKIIDLQYAIDGTNYTLMILYSEG